MDVKEMNSEQSYRNEILARIDELTRLYELSEDQRVNEEIDKRIKALRTLLQL